MSKSTFHFVTVVSLSNSESKRSESRSFIDFYFKRFVWKKKKKKKRKEKDNSAIANSERVAIHRRKRERKRKKWGGGQGLRSQALLSHWTFSFVIFTRSRPLLASNGKIQDVSRCVTHPPLLTRFFLPFAEQKRRLSTVLCLRGVASRVIHPRVLLFLFASRIGCTCIHHHPSTTAIQAYVWINNPDVSSVLGGSRNNSFQLFLFFLPLFFFFALSFGLKFQPFLNRIVSAGLNYSIWQFFFFLTFFFDKKRVCIILMFQSRTIEIFSWRISVISGWINWPLTCRTK